MDLPNQPNQTPRNLFNPLLEDFTITHLDDELNPHVYTLHGMEIGTFPTYIADYIEKHLIDHIGNYRGWEPNTQSQMEHIRREVEVNLDE